MFFKSSEVNNVGKPVSADGAKAAAGDRKKAGADVKGKFLLLSARGNKYILVRIPFVVRDIVTFDQFFI